MEYENPRHIGGDTIETHVNFEDGSDVATVYTTSRSVATKLYRLCEDKNTPWEVDKVYRDQEGKCVGYLFKTIKSAISFRSAIPHTNRVMTEEQREKSRERILKMHEARKKKQEEN